MQEINVFVVDDHQIFLDGIVSLLDDEPNIKIAGTAHNGKQAIERDQQLLWSGKNFSGSEHPH